MSRTRATRGFTLIELLIAVLIIGILAAIALPAFNEQRTRAKDSDAQQSLEAGLRAAKAVYAEGESFPSSGLAALLGRAERSQSFVDGNGFAAGQVAVERLDGQRLALRTQSRSGNRQLLVDDEAESRVTRYWGDNSRGYNLQSATNLLSNPSLETGLASWSAAPGTSLARVAQGSGWAMRWSGSAAGTVYADHSSLVITPGIRYSASVEVAAQAAPGGVRLQLDWRDSSNAYMSFSGSSVASAGTRRTLTVSGVAPAGSGRVSLLLGITGTGSVDVTADRFMLTASDAPLVYFDGDSAGGAWSGTAHASTSTGPAAPLR